MNCPNCGFDSPPEMRFCGACGTHLTAACPECGFNNPLGYRFCGMCGTRLARDSEPAPVEQAVPRALIEAESTLPAAAPPLEGERRVVTVVVTDLTESTTLLEKVGTEGWVELMHQILHILESEINRFGGEVSQFRGDGLVAFFGATLAHEDDPERAVLAALSMQQAMDLYVRERIREEAADLHMRVGVNTGEVIVTSTSDRQHWEETAMGFAVAIAARVESAAEPGSVLVSEQTYRLIESQFEWIALGEISVRGVSKPIGVYQPLKHLADREEDLPRHAFPDSLPRIGRDAEHHALKAKVKGLFEGRGGIAVVTGDEGSGKSFLVNGVRQYFAHRRALLEETQPDATPDSPSLRWVRGRCRSYSRTWPYSMWLDLFHDGLGLRPEQSKEEKRASLFRRAEELWGEELDEYYPYLATFYGLPLEEKYMDKVRHLDGEGLRQRFFIAIRSWIERASRSNPLVIAFSDLQWADESSIALLRYCLPIADAESLLWVFTFRPEPEAGIREFEHFLEAEYPHRLTSIALPPLTEEQSQALIDNLIGAGTLPDETSRLIIHNAGGNPYYIIELIRELIAREVLRRQEETGEWQITLTVTKLDLPDSLQWLLLARIDRLSAQERLTLQIAAVAGPVFWSNMVQALVGEPRALRSELAALQRTQFIQETGRVPELGMQYTFKSPLVRDTAYASLLNSQKAVYHLRAAEYLESLANPDVVGDSDGLLAYHYRGAGIPKKELFHTLLAAEQKRALHANAEALEHYDRAMELVEVLEDETASPEPSRAIQTQRFEVLNGRRHVHFQLGQVEASRADTQALLPLARQMGDDPIWLIDALLAQADISTDNRQELVPGMQMAREALELAQKLGDEKREMRSLTHIAYARFTLNDPSWREVAERALLLARKLGDLKTEVNLLLAIGGKYGMDDLPRGREYLQEALVRSETLNDKATMLPLLQAIGQQLERDGDYYRQLTEYEMERLRISREIGNRVAEGNALMFSGQVQALYLGDYEGGLELELQALRYWENMTDRLFPLLRIAQIQTALERHSEAELSLQMARSLEKKVVFDIGRAGLALVTVILYLALDDEEHLRSALDQTSQIQRMVADNLVSRQYQMAAACESSAIHLRLAQHCSERGDTDASVAHSRLALEASEFALDLYEEFGFVQIVECTSEEILFRHSQVMAASDRLEESREFLQRAYDEMMRKHDLIPAETPYRKTFLDNIQLHREIRTAYAAQSKRAGRRSRARTR